MKVFSVSSKKSLKEIKDSMVFLFYCEPYWIKTISNYPFNNIKLLISFSEFKKILKFLNFNSLFGNILI
jgi:hypothetical protein